MKSIDSILTALYGVISGPAGERDWNRFRSLFLPQARLTAAVKKAESELAAEQKAIDADRKAMKAEHGDLEKALEKMLDIYRRRCEEYRRLSPYSDS